MFYQINGILEDSWEKAVTPQPEDVSSESWFNIKALRKEFTMQFIQAYAQHDSEKTVTDAFEEKCLVDHIISLFVGAEDKMLDSESECIRFCEDRFGYKVAALHGFLKPNQRSRQEQIDEIDSLL